MSNAFFEHPILNSPAATSPASEFLDDLTP